MTRSVLLARITAVAFGINAALHTSAYKQVTSLAAPASADIQALIPLLWLCVSAGLVSVGMIVAAVASAPNPQRRAVLVFAATFPFAIGILQLIYLGLIAPVYLMAITGALTLAAAFVRATPSTSPLSPPPR